LNAAISLGKAIITGIVSGLAGLFDAVRDKIVEGVTGAIDWAKDHLGSTAEQYAAKNLGVPIGQGIIAGVLSQTKGLQNAVGTAGRATVATPAAAGISSAPRAAVATASSGSSGPGQFALVWAGPDFFRWMEEEQRRQRRGGRLA